ncbi:hypothetical protein [Brachybacterium sp. YJGR34]|uniref:hypothetical protein n=1 Tax=Brachybacterium sp. YJGR34 TaxID=2059911 RepID=UPI000E0A88B2|nr:hypothetical protein [Brachybacterium sp. YJGR34]
MPSPALETTTIAAPPALPAPEDYPWIDGGLRSVLLHDAGVLDLETGRSGPPDAAEGTPPLVDAQEIDRALAAAGAAPLAERTLVLAVGSNQAPATIARKYRRAARSLNLATPFVRCTVHGLGVGYVANSAAAGFVPAAPFRAVGERRELIATWFDDDQLAAIDETEPNYDRVRLDAADFPLELATGQRPAHLDLYASHRGVLARVRPLPLRRHQQELFRALAALTGDELVEGEAATICRELAARPEALRELVLAHGLVAEDGLPR